MTNLRSLFALLSALLLSAPTCIYAQTWDRNAQNPVATELWVDPPAVTPGAGMAPPSDAIVLFGSQGLSAWESVREDQPVGWSLIDGALTVGSGTGDIRTKQAFGDIQLHLEFRTPAPEDFQGPTGQGRGNSGVFFMEKYELQVLDSYQGDTYGSGQCGAIYKQYPPLVNASRPTQEWQVYDVVFMAPIFGEQGRMQRPATLTVFHNGVLIQNNVALLGPTEYIGQAFYQPHAAKLPLRLQDHGNPTSYRNIWVREL
jgi:hypothetical protein